MAINDDLKAAQGVSLIIPVFNSDYTIERCLDSVVKQDYESVEIIIVDDGSTDNSSEIIDDCVERVKNRINIKTIHKSNEGLINARITGIYAATYDIIAFVDSDDYIEPYHISTMIRKMQSAEVDLIACGCIRHENGKTEILNNVFDNGIYDEAMIKNEIYPQMLYSEGFFEFGLLPFMWNKLFKKELLLECYKNLDKSVYDGEDVLTFFSYMMKTKKMVISDAHTYHYCVTKNSMTRNKKPDYLENISRLYLSLNKVFSESDLYEVLRTQLDQYMRMMVKNSAPSAYIADEKFFFPFSEIPKNSRIIIYGAGLVGKNFVHQLNQTGFCEIQAWVDRNYDKLSDFEGVKIQSPELIKSTDFDYIVLALSDKEMAREIKNQLFEDYTIPQDKVVV